MRILIVTNGHPFEAEPFFAVFDALGYDWDHIEHPDAQSQLTVEGTESYDALVMYDMPGVEFTGDDPPLNVIEPTKEFRDGYLEMLEAGRGLVFMHHAIASWPSWPEFAEIVGGRFHYQPGPMRGVILPDSGYRHDVTHVVDVVETDHAICADLDSAFEITDEVYLYPVFEADVVPLMRSRHEFVDAEFYSAGLAIRGQRDERGDWMHPRGSNLVAWAKNAGNSPLAYMQFGDGPQTYADANYRKVLDNAIRWAASSEAHEWARERAGAS